MLERIRRLAVDGFDNLGQLGEDSWDYGEATGDARYCSIGRMLLLIHEWWIEHDECGGVPKAVVAELEQLLGPRLVAILDAPEAGVASRLARSLREEVEARLTGPGDWLARGDAHRCPVRPRLREVTAPLPRVRWALPWGAAMRPAQA